MYDLHYSTMILAKKIYNPLLKTSIAYIFSTTCILCSNSLLRYLRLVEIGFNPLPDIFQQWPYFWWTEEL